MVGRDPNTHLIAVSRDSPPGIAEREIRQSAVIVDAAIRVSATSAKPVVVFANMSTGLEPSVQERADAGGLPLLQGTRESLRAIEALIEYSEFNRRVPDSVAPSPVEPGALGRIRAELAGHPGPLSESTAKQLLAAFGIPVTRELVADSAERAVSCALELGYPVVLKIHSPDIQHKTEAGGVALNLSGPRQLRRAYDQTLRSARAHRPEARLDGVLVQEMAPADAIEVIVGSLYDPEFGPVVAFGLGGVLVELARDSVLRLAPVTPSEARAMTEEIRGAALLRGYRGRPPGDLEALADAIVRLSHLAHDLREEVAAVDINPLMVRPVGRGVLAADALVIRRQEAW